MIKIFYYRVTKYNPLYRDNNGRYIKKDWTSISDIGKCFDGIQLSFVDYKLQEDAYVESIKIVMSANKSHSLKIEGLENKGVVNFQDANEEFLSKFIKELHNEMFLYQPDIALITRLALREMVWCKLTQSESMFVHFGYDFYMYIGSEKKLTYERSQIERLGLYIEEHPSPYI